MIVPLFDADAQMSDQIVAVRPENKRWTTIQETQELADGALRSLISVRMNGGTHQAAGFAQKRIAGRHSAGVGVCIAAYGTTGRHSTRDAVARTIMIGQQRMHALPEEQAERIREKNTKDQPAFGYEFPRHEKILVFGQSKVNRNRLPVCCRGLLLLHRTRRPSVDYS
ncbi:MAG: hypothetical protein O3C60_17870 [Planctomycetota bacterium]|nr:hypothetical protein [Planctomycetota bacterium]